jgi:glucosamine-6-phosphate deaminase
MGLDPMQLIRCADAEAVDAALFEELRRAVQRPPRGWIGFATGDTYAGFFQRVREAVRRGALDLRELHATHLDEYLGCAPTQPGGMVHELLTRCPPLADLLEEGRFLPVPADGSAASLADHERRLASRGGIALQFLGLGRNGHIAFNEPGTPFERGFHRTSLAPETRVDALARFEPDEPPTEAVTAGAATVLAAQRLVVAATGVAKADAVRDMLEGPIDPSCPASVLRRHADCLVYVDEAAASQLP